MTLFTQNFIVLKKGKTPLSTLLKSAEVKIYTLINHCKFITPAQWLMIAAGSGSGILFMLQLQNCLKFIFKSCNDGNSVGKGDNKPKPSNEIELLPKNPNTAGTPAAEEATSPLINASLDAKPQQAKVISNSRNNSQQQVHWTNTSNGARDAQTAQGNTPTRNSPTTNTPNTINSSANLGGLNFELSDDEGTRTPPSTPPHARTGSGSPTREVVSTAIDASNTLTNFEGLNFEVSDGKGRVTPPTTPPHSPTVVGSPVKLI